MIGIYEAHDADNLAVQPDTALDAVLCLVLLYSSIHKTQFIWDAMPSINPRQPLPLVVTVGIDQGDYFSSIFGLYERDDNAVVDVKWIKGPNGRLRSLSIHPTGDTSDVPPGSASLSPQLPVSTPFHAQPSPVELHRASADGEVGRWV